MTIPFDRQSIRVNVRVQRFDPDSDRPPFFEIFAVDVVTGMTILEVLQTIKETQDSSLTFRASCRSSICGSCAIRVNGKAVLACSTQIIPTLVDHWKSSVEIAPLRHLPIIRDLVVDIEPTLAKITRLHPYLVEDRRRVPESLEQEALVSPEELRAYDRCTDCILCGSCTSNCSTAAVDSNYAGPLALAKAYRFSADPRDGFDLPRLQASQDHGLWSCAQCRKCMTTCPKDVRAAVAIQRLRRISIDQGIHDTAGSRRARAYLRDIVRFGQVNKPMLPVVVDGPPGWSAVEKEERFLTAHGLTPSLEVPTLPGQPHAARLHRQVQKIEAGPPDDAPSTPVRGDDDER